MKPTGENKEALHELAAESRNINALVFLFDSQIERLERAVLDCPLGGEADLWTMSTRRAELEGARKVRTGVVAYLNSLRQR